MILARLTALALVFATMPVTVTTAAHAAVFTLTGVVTSGYDNAYVGKDAPFGTPAASINLNTGETFGRPDGRSFELVVTIDETRGYLEEFSDGFRRSGDAPDSPATAAFTMNGVTRSFGNLLSDVAKAFVSPDRFKGRFEEYHAREDTSEQFVTNVLGNLDFDLFLPSTVFNAKSFTEPASWTRTGNEIANGYLSLFLQDTFVVAIQGPRGSEDHVVSLPRTASELYLRFDSLSVMADPVAAPVPETSAWAMMIGGLALVGGLGRRRRDRAIASRR